MTVSEHTFKSDLQIKRFIVKYILCQSALMLICLMGFKVHLKNVLIIFCHAFKK